MKKILSVSIVTLTLLVAGCSVFQTPKTPLQSTPGNEASATVNSNGFAFHMLDQQNSNLSLTINSNGQSSFAASGVTHTMDPGVITMSGKAYLDVLNAQYAAQQAMTAQILNFISSPQAAAMFAAKYNTNPPASKP